MKRLIGILLLFSSMVNGQNTILNGTAKNSMLIQGKDTTYLKSAASNWLKVGGKLAPKVSTDTVKGKMFDGEYLKIHSGNNIVTISPDSGIVLHGDATVFDDLFFPMSIGKSATAGYPPFVADSGYHTFTVDSTGVNRVIMYFTVQLPHIWKEGTTLHPHVHYKHTTTQGTPTFVVKYRWANIGSVFGAYSWVRLSTTTGTTANTHQLLEGGDISGTGKTRSSILMIELYLRSSTGNNTCDAYQFDIHIEKNRLGTMIEY